MSIYFSNISMKFKGLLLLFLWPFVNVAYGCQPAKMDFHGCTSAQLPKSVQIYNLGTVYYFGMGKTEIDVTKGCDLFEESAQMGYGLAQFNIGNCYSKGEGRQKDINKAIYWYKKAVVNNVMAAKMNLGFLYLYDTSDQKQHAEGVSLLLQAKKAGNVRASLTLGTAYYQGLGVDKNYTKAIELYEEAAKKGNSGAQALLSHIYSEGLYGVKSDNFKAKYWREIFAKNVFRREVLNWTVEYVIASSYKRGLGLPKDKEKYKYYLELSKHLYDCQFVKDCVEKVKTVFDETVFDETTLNDIPSKSGIAGQIKNWIKGWPFKATMKKAIPSLCANMNYCQCQETNDENCPRKLGWPPDKPAE
jgi:TPR repeat protein